MRGLVGGRSLVRMEVRVLAFSQTSLQAQPAVKLADRTCHFRIIDVALGASGMAPKYRPSSLP